LSNGKASAHGPARLQSYLNASIANIDRFVNMGFVDCNRLRAEAVDGDLLIAGHLCCQGEIVVEVEKLLENQGDGLVQTLFYRYQVGVQGGSPILRYDNSHGPGPEFAKDDPVRQRSEWHHKHELEWFDYLNPVSPDHLAVPNYDIQWPHLSDVLEEVHDWYMRFAEHLPAPEQYADPARCGWSRFAYCTDPPSWELGAL